MLTAEELAGFALSNRPAGVARPPAQVVLVADRFPSRGDPLVEFAQSLDGARVEFPDGWFLVRASNTEPSLTTRFEAATPERLAEIQGILREALRQFPEIKINF